MSSGRRAGGSLAHSRRSELRSGRSVLVLQVSASPAPGDACPLPTVPYTPFTSSCPPSQFVINCFLDDCLIYKTQDSLGTGTEAPFIALSPAPMAVPGTQEVLSEYPHKG